MIIIIFYTVRHQLFWYLPIFFMALSAFEQSRRSVCSLLRFTGVSLLALARYLHIDWKKNIHLLILYHVQHKWKLLAAVMPLNVMSRHQCLLCALGFWIHPSIHHNFDIYITYWLLTVSPRSPWGYPPHGPDIGNPGALWLPRRWGRHGGESLQAAANGRHHTGHQDKSRSVRFQPREADSAGEADQLSWRSLGQYPQDTVMIHRPPVQGCGNRVISLNLIFQHGLI